MKILLMKFRNIGDVLLSTPLIANLKHYYSDAQIDFALNKGCEHVISDNPDIDRIIVYEREKIKKMSLMKGIRQELNFINNIRNNHYDIVINLTEGDRGALLTLFSGADIKLGFRARKGVLSILDIYDKYGNDTKQQHIVEKDLQFITLLDKTIHSKKVSIYWKNNIDKEVESILLDNNLDSFVHIHPVSKWMFKCWEDEYMANIIDYLQINKKIKVLITSSSIESEMDKIITILSLCKSNPINLSGALTLKHVSCISSKAKIFFGIDSAPMHLAAATGTPVLSLFGASFPLQWGPWNNLNRIGGFTNQKGVQSNGIHIIISNVVLNGIYYENGIKKSKGMSTIRPELVKKTIDTMLE